MQENINKTEAKEPASHLSDAKDMAELLLNRYEPIQQNEAIKFIYERIKEDRLLLIENAEKNLAYLKNSYDLI